jgi:hypothetical protein
MSTVGYGDEGALTATGRGFMVFFIVAGLVSTCHHVDVHQLRWQG